MHFAITYTFGSAGADLTAGLAAMAVMLISIAVTYLIFRKEKPEQIFVTRRRPSRPFGP